MRKYSIIVAVAVLILFASCSKDNPDTVTLRRIAFGSCSMQTAPSGIYNYIVKKDPDLYLALGDNIYSDDGPDVGNFEKFIALNYGLLENNGNFQNLREHVPMIATWDDHDYGLNNSGAEFDKKDIGKAAFLKFWKVPADDIRSSREGVYNSWYYGDESHRVQVIMLDTRWFKTYDTRSEPLTPSYDASKTVLGEQQWTWLEEELRKPAKIRIIGSSTQFSTEHNGWEAWANFPLEQERMYEVLRRAKAEGVVFVSGDVHYAEFNKREPEGLYPIYDCTSSGLTHTHSPAASSIYRVGEAYTQIHFGMLDIDWETVPVQLKFSICNKTGREERAWVIGLDELRFP